MAVGLWEKGRAAYLKTRTGKNILGTFTNHPTLYRTCGGVKKHIIFNLFHCRGDSKAN